MLRSTESSFGSLFVKRLGNRQNMLVWGYSIYCAQNRTRLIILRNLFQASSDKLDACQLPILEQRL
jgi:hypothetical protein